MFVPLQVPGGPELVIIGLIFVILLGSLVVIAGILVLLFLFYRSKRDETIDEGRIDELERRIEELEAKDEADDGADETTTK